MYLLLVFVFFVFDLLTHFREVHRILSKQNININIIHIFKMLFSTNITPSVCTIKVFIGMINSVLSSQSHSSFRRSPFGETNSYSTWPYKPWTIVKVTPKRPRIGGHITSNYVTRDFCAILCYKICVHGYYICWNYSIESLLSRKKNLPVISDFWPLFWTLSCIHTTWIKYWLFLSLINVIFPSETVSLSLSLWTSLHVAFQYNKHTYFDKRVIVWCFRFIDRF